MASIFVVGKSGQLPSAWRRALRFPWSPHRLVGSGESIDEALSQIKQLQPEIVLLDAQHQNGQGLVACRTLSCDGGVVPPTVIAISDNLDQDEREAFLRAGASGYLLKSINSDSLSIALRGFAEMRAEGDDTIEIGPISEPPIEKDLEHEDWSKVSRREALTWLAVGSAIAAVPTAGLIKPALALADDEEQAPIELVPLPPPIEGESDVLRMQREVQVAMKKPLDQRRWVMVIDTRKCFGCSACTIGCKSENHLPPGVVYRPVIQEELGTYPNVARRFLPRPCMQCDRPPCVPVCPVGATWKREDGIIEIDYNQCIGCRYCIAACPYSARTFDFGEFYTADVGSGLEEYEKLPSNEYSQSWDRVDGGSPVGNARKCHFCIHRLNVGQLPTCVTTCIGFATFFGDANDPKSLVSEMIVSNNAIRLKEELGTKPKVYYLV